MENTALIWIAAGLIIIGVAAAILSGVVAPRERSGRLRRDFGPGYDRTIERRGDRSQAEADLMETKSAERGGPFFDRLLSR